MAATPKLVRTACTRDCPDACGVVATVEGDRVVQLRGDPTHPVTRGFLCYRTNHYLAERQYSPERLARPLVRGRSGDFEEVNWDAALDLCAERLLAAKAQFGPASILHYQSGGSLGAMKLLNGRLFEHFGPVTRKRGDICSGAGDAAQLADFGVEDAHDLDDLENSRAILLWGKNVAETGVHLIPYLKAARARGVRVVQIDPVFSPRTATLCDTYLQPRPGADGALALAMLRAIFDEGWVSPRAESTCDNLAGLRALASRRTFEAWCATADIAPQAVMELARWYATTTPAALFVGWGLARRAHGAKTVRLLDALGAVTGNLGIPGGGVTYYFRRRGGFDETLGATRAAHTLLEPRLGAEILAADPPIKLAFIDNGNPVSQLPDSNTVARALRSIDFLVVLDAFMTDTAELAHVVLPTTTMLEEHDVLGAYGHHWVQLAQPAVPAFGEARSDLEIYQGLANRLGLADVMAGTPESWIERLIEPMRQGGVTRDALLERALRKPHAPHVLFSEGFATPSGRAQLIDDFPVDLAPVDPTFPLTLMSISTHKNQASQLERAAQASPPEVTVHPDAAPAGAKDGGAAQLVSPLATVEVIVRFDAQQRRDLVIFPKGRWAKFGGPNTLIRAVVTDMGEGAAYYDQGVRLELA
ncbi:MAG: molybdopterin-dependent oxidoreductase [Polyangiaceae bacterium]